MSERFTQLKSKENPFKKNSLNRNKEWKNKKNERGNVYIPPHKKEKVKSQFKKNNTVNEKAFKPDLIFKEKEGDFPSLNDKVELRETNNSETKVSFANLVKNIEKPEIISKPKDLNLVEPGWIRWRKNSKTGKWIEERGPRSKKYKKFLRWLEEFKYYKKVVAFENYLDLLEKRELEELEINGPKYKNSWDPDSEPESDYESDIEDDLSESSDSDSYEYIDDNDYN